MRLQFANGVVIEADVAIGADGLRSAVRAALFGAERPHFTGYIAYRGLVPIASLPAGIISPTSCLSTGPGPQFHPLPAAARHARQLRRTVRT